MPNFFLKLLNYKKQDSGPSLEQQLVDSSKQKRRTLSPNSAPENADEELRNFFKKTECLQPYLNARLGGYWSFDEEPGHYATLGTYDRPDYGRTYKIRHNAALVGKLSVAQDPLPRNTSGISLRLRLQFPIELLPSEWVHGLLTMLASSVFDTAENEASVRRAEQLATSAMTLALWDVRAIPGNSIVVEMNISGTFGVYQTYIDHWNNSNVSPWEEIEARRDMD